MTQCGALFGVVQLDEVFEQIQLGELQFGFESVSVLVGSEHGEIFPRLLTSRKRILEWCMDSAARRFPLGFGSAVRGFLPVALPPRTSRTGNSPGECSRLF